VSAGQGLVNFSVQRPCDNSFHELEGLGSLAATAANTALTEPSTIG
jgi:hypothetical protein